ncbi:MAG: cyclic nucleotide-binding domain-containing protein [Pseudomonadota bacterium]
MSLLRHSTKHDLLKKVPLFSKLSKSNLEDIAKSSDEVSFPVGTVLAREGETGHEFVFVLDGEARVESGGAVINRLGPGSFFGEIALLDGKSRTASVIADTDMALLVVQSQYFTQVLEKAPKLQMEIISALCRYLREAQSQKCDGASEPINA